MMGYKMSVEEIENAIIRLLPEELARLRGWLDELELFEDLFPSEVCHYTSVVAAENILKNKVIRINQLGKTNDPKESKWWNDPMLQWGSGDMSIINVQAEANRIKSEEWKVFCTTCHNNPAEVFSETRQEFDHYRFGFSRSRMWTQYAESHKGICLLIDAKKFDSNLLNALTMADIFHGFVKYNYESSVRHYPPIADEIEKYGLTEGIRKSIARFYDENFLFKSPDWKEEHEFRWLVHSPKNQPEFVSVDGAIRMVVLGTDFSSSTLIEFCKELNIPLRKMTWDKGRPYALKYG